MIRITLWETEADLLANETSGSYRNQVAKISLCLADQPLREAYVTGIAESANTGFKHNPPRPDPDRLRIAPMEGV